MANKIPVAVLGATGAVGQRFIQLLQDHPVFETAALTASDRSEGKRYADAVHWVIEGDIPTSVRDMVLLPTSWNCRPARQLCTRIQRVAE
jgi:aspartate-semialdehyde dehydrogenase